jgi:hypothetical protein
LSLVDEPRSPAEDFAVVVDLDPSDFEPLLLLLPPHAASAAAPTTIATPVVRTLRI